MLAYAQKKVRTGSVRQQNACSQRRDTFGAACSVRMHMCNRLKSVTHALCSFLIALPTPCPLSPPTPRCGCHALQLDAAVIKGGLAAGSQVLLVQGDMREPYPAPPPPLPAAATNKAANEKPHKGAGSSKGFGGPAKGKDKDREGAAASVASSSASTASAATAAAAPATSPTHSFPPASPLTDSAPAASGASGQYDMVMCLLGTLTHMLTNRDAAAALRQAGQALRQGGLLLLELPHPGGPSIVVSHASAWPMRNSPPGFKRRACVLESQPRPPPMCMLPGGLSYQLHSAHTVFFERWQCCPPKCTIAHQSYACTQLRGPSPLTCCTLRGSV